MKNKNSILCTTMLATLWEEKNVDNIDLVSDFIKYILQKEYGSNKTKAIDKNLIKEKLEKDYSFDDFPNPVIDKVLSRLSHKRILRRNNNYYYLIKDLSPELALFEIEMAKSAALEREIMQNLNDYLKTHCSICKDICIEETREHFINFLEELGYSIATQEIAYGTIDTKELGPIFFHIGKFLSNLKSEKDSENIKIVEKIINGINIAKVIYLIGEHSEDTPPTEFKNTVFFFDTSLMLAVLGLKSNYENQSAKFIYDKIKQLNGEIQCFTHTVEEIRSAIVSYKKSLSEDATFKPQTTIEFFKEKNFKSEDVENYLTVLDVKIQNKGIRVVPSPSYNWGDEENYNATKRKKYIDEKALLDYLENVMNIKHSSAVNDTSSISSIFLLRDGYIARNIENCKAMFVTTNSMLATSVSSFLHDTFEGGLSTIISDINIGAYLWAKTYKTDKEKYPLTRLILNANASVRPTEDFYEIFYASVQSMIEKGFCTEEEAIIIKEDTVFQNIVYDMTESDLAKVPDAIHYQYASVIEMAKDKIRTETQKEILQENYKKLQKQRADRNAEIEYKAKEVAEKFSNNISKVSMFLLKGLALVLSIILFISSINVDGNIKLIMILSAIISASGFCLDLFGFVNKIVNKISLFAYDYRYSKKLREYRSFKIEN